MATKTSFQFYSEEQLKLLKNKSEKPHNELQKEVGKKWKEMNDSEKQPYVNKKREYEEQYKREAEVLKTFSKQKSLEDKTSPATFLQTLNSVVNPQQGTKSTSQAVNDKSINQSRQESGVELLVGSEKNQVQKVSQSSQEGSSGRLNNHKVYLEFYAQQYEKYRKLYPDREGKELTKVISQEWKLMQLSCKRKSKVSQETPKTEKQQLEECAKGFIRISGKEVAIPKKPLSAYLRYYLFCFEQIMSKMPDLEPNEIAEVASQSWNALIEKKKEKYNQAFQEENKIYYQQKQLFISKYGFFPTSNSKITYSKEEQKAAQNKKGGSLEDKRANSQRMSNQNVKSEENNTHKPEVTKSGTVEAPPVKLSGYYLFEKTLRMQLQEREHSMNARELSAFIGAQWKQFPQESKKEYEDQQEREYLKQRNAYVAKYGSFPVQEKKISGAAAVSVASRAAKDAKQLKLFDGKSSLIKTTKPASGSASVSASAAQSAPEFSKKSSVVSTNSPAAPRTATTIFQQSSNWKTSSYSSKKPQLTLEEQEEELERRIARKQKINYDDVESELDDLQDCISSESESDIPEEYIAENNRLSGQRQYQLQYEDQDDDVDDDDDDDAEEEEQYKVEEDSDNDQENEFDYHETQMQKKLKNNAGESFLSSKKTQSALKEPQFKERNTLFDLLNQPVRIPNFNFRSHFK